MHMKFSVLNSNTVVTGMLQVLKDVSGNSELHLTLLFLTLLTAGFEQAFVPAC